MIKHPTPEDLAKLPVTLTDVYGAAERIRDYTHLTPLIPSRTFSQMTGARVYLKAENLQVIGAFKARGAFNKILQLSPEQRRAGVITYSSGNHAQAVARAGQALGIKAVVVMPIDAPKPKVEATRDTYGAEVHFCGTTSTERKALAEKFAAERGLTMIPPFDDEQIVAGQGTVGLEILREVPDVDVVLVPVGGGGLLSGVAVAIKSARPRAAVYGVEPETANAMHLSLKAGHLVTIPPSDTEADGLKPVQPGHIPFIISEALVDDVKLIDDARMTAARALLEERSKLVVEPSGAVGLAWLLAQGGPRKNPLRGHKVVVILSGGNIDPEYRKRHMGPIQSDLFDQ